MLSALLGSARQVYDLPGGICVAMSKLGGWWMASYRLSEGESLEAKYPANHFHRNRRPYGGRLYITDRRVIFLPHRLDRVLGGSETVLSFEQIEHVRVESPADRSDPESAVPERLQIDTVSAETHLFVVSDLESAYVRIANAVDPVSATDEPPE